MTYWKITYLKSNGETQIDKNSAKTVLEAISNFYNTMGYEEIIKIEIDE